jgi:hypothetical protein
MVLRYDQWFFLRGEPVDTALPEAYNNDNIDAK